MNELPPTQKPYRRPAPPLGVQVAAGTRLDELLCAHVTCDRAGCHHTTCGAQVCGRPFGVAEYGHAGSVVRVWLVPQLHELATQPGQRATWAWSRYAAVHGRPRSPRPVAAYGNSKSLRDAEGTWQVIAGRQYSNGQRMPRLNGELRGPRATELYAMDERSGRLISGYSVVPRGRLPILVRCLCGRPTVIERA